MVLTARPAGLSSSCASAGVIGGVGLLRLPAGDRADRFRGMPVSVRGCNGHCISPRKVTNVSLS